MAQDAPQEECRGAVRDPEPRRHHGKQHRARDHRKLPAAHIAAQRPGDRTAESAGIRTVRVERPADRADRPRDAEAALLSAIRAREIGRAPCRERVCQYVSISVVAVSLKNKTVQSKINDKTIDNKT